MQRDALVGSAAQMLKPLDLSQRAQGIIPALQLLPYSPVSTQASFEMSTTNFSKCFITMV